MHKLNQIKLKPGLGASLCQPSTKSSLYNSCRGPNVATYQALGKG